MRKSASLTSRIISMLLAIILVFYTLPLSAIAQEISNSNAPTVTPSNTSEEQGSTNNNSTDQKPYTYYNEVYEEASLREESVKHFRLEDGSYVAAQYASPVHYLDEEGEWQNIDNTLAESGSEFVTSDARVKFIKKTTGNGNIFTLHDGNTKISLSLSGANKKVNGIVTNTEESETTEIGKLMSLEGLSSRIRYNEILDGVDIEYVLDSLSIKENIIIKEKRDAYAYTFTLSLNGLEAELLSSGDISITKNGEQKYTIPAPVVFDFADSTAPVDAASYSLIDNGNGKYTLTVSVSHEWMNSPDRAYPVTLDPAIVKGVASVVTDTYGEYGHNRSHETPMFLYVSSNQTALIKLNQIPTMPIGAKLSKATITLVRTHGGSDYVGAYFVNNDWTQNIEALDVATVSTGELLDYCCTSVNSDGLYVEEDLFTWDITNAFQSWYNGTANNGIALKNLEESGSTSRFASSLYYTGHQHPVFAISYVNTTGLEDYYSYSTQDGGAAGTGHVNYATGELTFAIGTLTSTDYLMPVTPTLVYNSAWANEYYTSAAANTPYSSPVTAYGFKLNLTETIVKCTYDVFRGTKTYYVWSDGDGTEHFFYQSEDDPNLYIDDSGLLLNLVVETETYDGYVYPYTTIKITDIDKNVRIFERFVDDANYDQGPWYLAAINDKVGNRMILSYGDDAVDSLALYPKNSGRIGTFALIYTSGILRYILSHDNSICVALRYSDTYNGEISATASNYLRQVVYAHGTNTSSSTWMTYYSSGSASGIVTDATMYYEYDANGYLISAKNGLADYTVNYEWTDGKVTSIYEKGGTTQGVKLGFTYGIGYTEVTTPGGDGNYSTTADNIINRYSYDSFYRVVSTYSTSYDRGTIYGASSGIYSNSSNAANSASSSSTESKTPVNRLIETYTIGGSHTNYLLNGNFSLESDAGEILYWNRSHNTIVPDTILDAIKIPSASGTYYISQVVYLSPGDYTFSFDIRTTNASNFIIEAVVSGSAENISTVNVNKLTEAQNFYTHSMVINVSLANTYELKIRVRSSGTVSPDTTVYIANARLEKAIGASQYNFINVGSFDDNYRNADRTDPSNITQETFWTTTAGVSFVLDSSSNTFGKVAKISGSLTRERYLSQLAYESPPMEIQSYPNTGKNFIVSGFAKAPQGAFSNNLAKFALRVDIYYGDIDGTERVRSQYIDFDNDCTDWQFVSAIINTEYENHPEDGYTYDYFTKIVVVCEFSHQNGGEAYFDNISLIDAAGSWTEYSYNEYGLITAIEGPFDSEYREYDGTNLVRVANDDGEFWDYTYNENGMIAEELYYTYSYSDSGSGIEKAPITKTDYEYNAYGQITSVETYPVEMNGTNVIRKSGSASIKTLNEYITTSGSAIFGALQTTSDGTGRMLKYFYDTSRGYLLAEVNVGAGTGTAYTYDAIGNLISARPATCDSEGTSYSTVTGAESVTYSYNTKNELSKITTASSTYTFAYDSFGNLSRFVEGDVRYYYNNTGKLRGAYYRDSNDLSFEYEYYYDKLGRLATEYAWYEEEIDSYEDEDGNVYIEYEYTDILLKEYEYTADGKLYRVYDALNEEYVQYNYDVKGRLETVLRYGSDRINDFVTEYDYDSLSGTEEHLRAQEYGFSYLVGASAVDIRIENDYSYDARNRLSEEAIERDGVTTRIEYSYDDFGRLSEKETTSGSLTQQENYSYRTVDGVTTGEVATYTSKVGNATNTYTYTYDARGNIVSIELNGDLQYEFIYDDLGQLIYEENFVTDECYSYEYDNAGNIVLRVDNMGCEEYEYIYAPSPYGDRLVSFNGETISYDSSGRTVVYRGKQITYLQADANKIASIGNVSFTYDADGMRRSKTVNGVTHYYTYDGIQLVKEEWGNNVMIFLYDALGSPIGMQYRNSTYAEDIWDIYYYEKNLQGDIVAVYSSTGTKLVSYDYDAWGYISCVTYSNGGASTSVVHNPLRYRGYYYDDDLDLYYLATRYYDPEVCRFITADSYVSTGQGILGHNMYAYCGSNPVMRIDPTGESWLAILLLTPLGGIAFQITVSAICYAGIAVASMFDEDIKDDMDAIGWNPLNTDSSVITGEDSEKRTKKVSFYKGVPVFIFKHDTISSFSFGGIFLNDQQLEDDTLNHEYGHSVQQMLLGPLAYSIFVAFPSAHYCFTGDYIGESSPLREKMYFSKIWERTADWLGGVNRDDYYDFLYIGNFIFW